MLAGIGENLDANATVRKPITFASSAQNPTVDELSVLRVLVGDNYVVSAQVTVTLVFALGA